MGVYHKDTNEEFHNGPVPVADRKLTWYTLERRRWSFKRSMLIILSAIATAQCCLSCGIYYSWRMLPHPGVFTGIDHRNGWMAFGGAISGAVAIFHLITDYE
ncbi:hypothetical protein B0J14DRAFT_645846 [Halenospora varia]|nr:hypothetical protein B0J14DRAFT_645846 [Halenospora varia]